MCPTDPRCQYFPWFPLITVPAQDLMGNITIVLVYMSSRLEQVGERKGRGLTVDEVQEVVRLGATQFPRDRCRHAFILLHTKYFLIVWQADQAARLEVQVR